MTYRNSEIIKYTLYFAIVFFPVVSVFSAIYAYEEVQSEGLRQGSVLLFAAVFFGYLTPIGVKLRKFVHREYRLSEEGMEIKDRSGSTFFPWNKDMRIKDSAFLQLFWLYGQEGRPIAMVDYMMPGFEEFSDFIQSKVQA